MMSKSITFIGNGKMALALAKGLCKTHTIEVISPFEPQKAKETESVPLHQ